MHKWSLKKYRGKWAAVTRIQGRTIRRSSGTANRVIAEQWLHEFVRIQNAPRETIKDIYDAYKAEKSENERRKLDIMWKHLREFEHLRPDQINREAARKYAEERKFKGTSDNTIIRELGALRAALRWYDKSYPRTFYMPSKPDPKDEFITKEQFYRLLDAAHSKHIRLFIILAIVTAGRTSAILELKWNQVDFERKMINLGKGTRIKRRAEVPLNDLAMRELTAAYEERDCDYIISYAGQRVFSIRKGFDNALKKANLPRVTPHALRRSAARWMAEAGRLMSEIAQYLGHSSTEVTEKVYARFSPDYLRKASDVLQ